MHAQTLSEKILSAKSGASVRAGDIVLASVDLAYSHDGNRPLAMDQLPEMGAARVSSFRATAAIPTCGCASSTSRRTARRGT